MRYFKLALCGFKFTCPTKNWIEHWFKTLESIGCSQNWMKIIFVQIVSNESQLQDT